MKPVLQAILLAERVYQDVTGKKIIAGTFNTLMLKRGGLKQTDHPTEAGKNLIQGTDIGSVFLYVSLTDLVPDVDVLIRIVNITKNKVVLECPPIKINCNDRLATVELVLPMPPASIYITEPGAYSVDLLWNDELLGSHRVMAVEVPEPGQA